MQPGTVRVLSAVAVLISLVAAPSARAQIDMGGAWSATAQVLGTSVGTVTQTGTALASTLWGRTWTGTIDLATGAFSMQAPAEVGPCSQLFLSGSVEADGTAFAANIAAAFPGILLGQCVPVSWQAVGTRCGNGVLDAGEGCDDGNRADGDCCSAACIPAPADTPCGGSGVCTQHACDGAGACVARCPCTSRRAACIEAPVSQLTIVNRTPDAGDVVRWKFARGTIGPSELGDPTTVDQYALCVFDAATPTPLFVTRAPAGGAWTRSARGVRYRSGTREPDGLRSLAITAGAGKAKVVVKGQGELLPLPAAASPWPVPLLVQLQSDAGGCWQAAFGAPTSNTGATLKAKSP